MTESGGEGWFVTDDSRQLLLRIRGMIGELAPLAETGDAMIALGEVWNAIDAILDDQSIEASVLLTVGFRRSDPDNQEGLEEGLFMCVRVDGGGLTLEELNTTYSKDVGSDRFTVNYGSQSAASSLDLIDVQNWISKLKSVKGWDDARLAAYRDHV